MLLHRIANALRNQRWLTFTIELIVVVTGIFLGLQADNWNEDRQARAASKVYYARLADDLRTELELRRTRIAYYERVRAHGEAALHALEGHREALDSDFLVDVYQATQVWNYTPQRTTYDELLSSGIANALPDTDLRRRIANFYVSLENSRNTLAERTPLRERLRFHMPHAVQQVVRDSCGDRYIVRSQNVTVLELPETCTIDISEETVEDALQALESYPQLKGDLNRNLADIDMKLQNLAAYTGAASALISKLELASERGRSPEN